MRLPKVWLPPVTDPLSLSFPYCTLQNIFTARSINGICICQAGDLRPGGVKSPVVVLCALARGLARGRGQQDRGSEDQGLAAVSMISVSKQVGSPLTDWCKFSYPCRYKEVFPLLTPLCLPSAGGVARVTAVRDAGKGSNIGAVTAFVAAQVTQAVGLPVRNVLELSSLAPPVPAVVPANVVAGVAADAYNGDHDPSAALEYFVKLLVLSIALPESVLDLSNNSSYNSTMDTTTNCSNFLNNSNLDVIIEGKPIIGSKTTAQITARRVTRKATAVSNRKGKVQQ